jgi:hypothetical protein
MLPPSRRDKIAQLASSTGTRTEVGGVSAQCLAQAQERRHSASIAYSEVARHRR